MNHYRLFQLFAALSFLLTIACSAPTLDQTASSPANCRVVQHALDPVCIPHQPKRIVALDSTGLVDPLLALGIRPIGMATHSIDGKEDLAGLGADEVAGIARVGDVSSPSLESILKLKPDLILGMSMHEQIYPQLSRIAPTVLVEHQEQQPIKNYLRSLARILDQEQAGAKVLSHYQSRIAAIQAQLDRPAQTIEVTVLEHRDGSYFIPGVEDAPHEILSDIGFTDNVAQTNYDRFLSVEILDRYDADILFVMDYGGQSHSFSFQNPLIAPLKAVRRNRAFMVKPSTWHTSGILGANRILDDISRFLTAPAK